MSKGQNISIEAALQSLSTSARREAFKNNLPVAISENGKAILLYADGKRRCANGASLAKVGTVTHDPKLDKLTGEVLFPKKVEAANKVVANLKWAK